MSTIKQVLSIEHPPTATPSSETVGRPAAGRLHLDFHTSGDIADVARDFDAEAFADRLVRAGVASVTLFAKCHHSWCYYPSRVGVPHPGLARTADGNAIDLLGLQIAACHARGIQCPVYLTVGWSEADAQQHPEWCVYGRDGRPVGSADIHALRDADPDAARPHVAWTFLDVGDGTQESYGHHLLEMVRELCSRYPLDGLFLDICLPMANYGPNRNRIEAASACDEDGQDAGLISAAWDRWHAWARRVDRCLHAAHPKATLFFNGMAESDTPDGFLALQTHLEIEDLPTFWGGYDRLPIRARCLSGRAEASHKPFVAMSGRFHTMWGEFGGYKHPSAIRMEAIMMAANACRCSFGDQLPPSGELDLEAMDRIEPAMKVARSLDEFVDRAAFVSSLAILRTPKPTVAVTTEHAKDAIHGLGQALLELHREFRVISPEDLSAKATSLRAIMVAEAIQNRQIAAAITQFAERGGRVLLVGPHAIESALSHGLACGLQREPGPEFDVDYIRPAATLSSLATQTEMDLSHGPVLCYQSCLRLRTTTAEVLAEAIDPYFSRTMARYCSHRHSPPNPHALPRPAITANGVGRGTIYCLGHEWGQIYQEWGMRLHRDLLGLVLLHADPHPTVAASLPSAARVSLLRQEHLDRYVLHLVYAPPIRRGCVEVLEDFPALPGSSISLNLGRKPRRAWQLESPDVDLPLSRLADGSITLTYPGFTGHTAIVLED